MLLSRTLLAAFAALGLSGCATPDNRVNVIAGATSVDPPISRAVIVVKGGRIVAIGPEKSTAIPPASRRLNGAGRWIVPEIRGQSLRAGGAADLLLLSGDPRKHPSNYHRVERAMRGGRWIEGPTH